MIIGIAGGTGSGKTTVAKKIRNTIIGKHTVVMMQQDSYYRDHSNIPFEEREKINYDHPDSIDIELLIKHLKTLISGSYIDVPIYDFTTHTRKVKTKRENPVDIVIIEGILIFTNKELRELFDYKIFVDTPGDIRFIRRLKRDLVERNRTVNSVIEQYLTTVRPMHIEFVEPSKQFADIIIPEGGFNKNAIDVDVISSSILHILKRGI
ncbi:MAG: uridine kinase [Proteobacteria bacterium]|nr:uridine kinase [Pseudomonadota bacterium]